LRLTLNIFSLTWIVVLIFVSVVFDPIIHRIFEVLACQHVKHDSVCTVAPRIEPSQQVVKIEVFLANGVFDLAVLGCLETVSLKELDKLSLVLTKRDDGDKFENSKPP